jgi:hypothetical protein
VPSLKPHYRSRPPGRLLQREPPGERARLAGGSDGKLGDGSRLAAESGSPKLTEYLQQRAIESGLGKLTRSDCTSPAAVRFVASVLACHDHEAKGLLTNGLIAYLPLP